jgi:hypothetical protein
MPNLTKPQADLLFGVMKQDAARAAAPGPAVRRRMMLAGYIALATSSTGYSLTREGFAALLYYWRVKDANSGRMCDMERRQEVEAALAFRFPEPLKLAA